CAGGALELARRQLPARLRPFVRSVPPPDAGANGPPEEPALASASLPVTCLVGDAHALLRFATLLRRRTNRERLRDVWPGLAAVVYRREPGAVERGELAAGLGLTRADAGVL